MVKVTQKKVNKTVRQVSNDISIIANNLSTASTTTSNSNTSVDAANATESDDVENHDYTQQSSVWKFATKISPEKARCNLCQIGKHLEESMHNYIIN